MKQQLTLHTKGVFHDVAFEPVYLLYTESKINHDPLNKSLSDISTELSNQDDVTVWVGDHEAGSQVLDWFAQFGITGSLVDYQLGAVTK